MPNGMLSNNKTQRQGFSPFAPLKIIRKRPARLGGFLLLYVVVGLLGVLVAIFVPIFDTARSIGNEFIATLRTGGLYTFTIAFLTSSVALLYEAKAKNVVDEQIKSWKQFVLNLAIALVAIMSALAGMQAFSEAVASEPKIYAFTLKDCVQVTVFLIGICLAIYAFLLASHEEELDDFADSSDEARDDLKEKSESATDDGRNISI